MADPFQPEDSDAGVGRLSAAIIVAVFGLQLAFSGMHLLLAERFPPATFPGSSQRESPVEPTAVQVCGSADVDMAACEATIAPLLRDPGTVKYCVPPGDSRSAGSIMRRYLVEHPDETTRPMAELLNLALAQSWPCRPPP
jgi:hypothetical protein